MHKSIFLSAALIASVAMPAGAATMLVDDFESGLPVGTDTNGLALGISSFAPAGASVVVGTQTTPPAAEIPGKGTPNTVLEMNIDSTTLGGFYHMFQNAAVDTWVSQDWSGFDGISFWLQGANTGNTLFVDILDNRNPGSVAFDAEFWTVEFEDDFLGWQKLEFAFADFTRLDVGNNAPDDGMGLTEMFGYGVGAFDTGGPQSYLFDDVELWTDTTTAVPLPASGLAMGLALVGFGCVGRRRKASV